MSRLPATVLVVAVAVAWPTVVQGDASSSYGSSSSDTAAKMSSLGSSIKNAVQDMKGELRNISALTKSNTKEHAAETAAPKSYHAQEAAPKNQHAQKDAEPEVTSYEESVEDETVVEDGKGKEWQTHQVCTNGHCKTTHVTHKLTPQQVSDWMLAPFFLAQTFPTALKITLATLSGVLAGSGLTLAVFRLNSRAPSPKEEPLLEA